MVSGSAIGVILAGIGAVTFFGLDGAGKIKGAFADTSQTGQATKDVIDNSSNNTEKIDLSDNLTDDDKTNNVVITQNGNQSQKDNKVQGKNDILILTKPTKLTSNRAELPKSTVGVQIRKPSFVTKEEKANPTAFNKRKFGIDEAALQKAQTKSSSKQTTKEKLLIEAEKGRQIFDSRSISNF